MEVPDTDLLHFKLDQILQSKDPEWVTVVAVTLDVLHRQFVNERHRVRTVVRFRQFGTAEAAGVIQKRQA